MCVHRTYYWNESTDAVTWEKPTRPSRYGGMGEPCAVCNKTVYLAERRSAGGVAYHAECFRCSACKKKLEASLRFLFLASSFCTSCEFTVLLFLSHVAFCSTWKKNASRRLVCLCSFHVNKKKPLANS